MSKKNNKRGLKTRVSVSNSYDKELYEKIKELSKETMVPISRLMDLGMRLVLERYKKD